MRQLVLPDDWDGSPACVLTGRQARRLSSVLRMAPGDAFPAIGPDGALYECSVTEVGRDRVAVSVSRAGTAAPPDGYKPDIRAGRARPAVQLTEKAARAAESAPAAGPAAAPDQARTPRIVLAVGMLKGSKLDDVVRAATEAGVSAIAPLATARSVPREHAGGRVERLRRVVAEALGQSGSPVPTRVLDPMTLPELVSAMPPSPGKRLGLFFHETPLAQSSIHRYCTDVPDEIIACVGPEGGFDDDEVRALAEGGFMSAWLGPTVLRAETAAVFAVASLRVVCLERSSWSMTEYEE